MREDIKDLMLNNVQTDDVLADSHDLFEHLDYDGGIHQLIDSSVDIYYYDLRKWAVDNYGFIEQAMEEGLCEGVTDFHALIQYGQYVQLSEEAREIIDDLYTEYDGKLFNVAEVA